MAPTCRCRLGVEPVSDKLGRPPRRPTSRPESGTHPSGVGSTNETTGEQARASLEASTGLRRPPRRRHTERVLAVLRTPGVLPLSPSSCVARLPMGALSLLLVLHTKDLTGSYGHGGVAAGVFALSLGVSAPALARIIDRRGQAGVLRFGALVSTTAIVVIALLPDGAPFGAIIAASAV